MEKSSMRDFVECFCEVEQDDVNLSSIWKVLGNVLDGFNQLRFWWAFLRKPCWLSHSILCWSKWLIMLLCMTCSRSLHVIDFKDTGRWFPCKCYLPSYIWFTFHAYLHSSWTIPVWSDHWNIKVLICASSLSIKAGMESGRLALVDLRFFSSL